MSPEQTARERDAFEKWYCDDAAENGLTFTPAEISALRDGDYYGDRVALNSKWEGWKALATLSRGEGGDQERRAVPELSLSEADEPKLPHDVEINHIRFRKGVALKTLVAAATRWHTIASETIRSASLLDDEFTAEGRREGSDLIDATHHPEAGAASREEIARAVLLADGSSPSIWDSRDTARPGTPLHRQVSHAFKSADAILSLLAERREDKELSPRAVPLQTIGEPMPYFCKDCQAIPKHGYCKLKGCPTAPAQDAEKESKRG